MPIIKNIEFEMVEDYTSGGANVEEIKEIEKEMTVGGFSKKDLLEVLNFAQLAYGDDNYHTEKYNLKLLSDGYKTISDYRKDGWEIKSFSHNNENAGRIFFKQQIIIVAYQGTDSLKKLKVDLRFSKIPFEISKDTDSETHKGFYSYSENTYKNIFDLIQDYALKKNYNIADCKFTFTGHSLGGGNHST